MTRKVPKGFRIITVTFFGGPCDGGEQNVQIPVREKPIRAIRIDGIEYLLKQHRRKLFAYHPHAAKLLEGEKDS